MPQLSSALVSKSLAARCRLAQLCAATYGDWNWTEVKASGTALIVRATFVAVIRPVKPAWTSSRLPSVMILRGVLLSSCAAGFLFSIPAMAMSPHNPYRPIAVGLGLLGEVFSWELLPAGIYRDASSVD